MRSIKRWSLFLLLVFMVATFLAGCSSSTPATPDQQGDKAQAPPVQVENKDVILATTTSTRDSGLLDVLLPIFEKQSGYVVKPIAVGTGQALAMGERGEADVLLVHAPASEMKLVESGVVVNRQLIMHNDFIVVGPAADSAGIKGLKTAV